MQLAFQILSPILFVLLAFSPVRCLSACMEMSRPSEASVPACHQGGQHHSQVSLEQTSPEQSSNSSQSESGHSHCGQHPELKATTGQSQSDTLGAPVLVAMAVDWQYPVPSLEILRAERFETRIPPELRVQASTVLRL